MRDDVLNKQYFCWIPAGNVQRYTVQCLLRENLWTSRFMTLLFLWLFVVLVVSVWSLFAWMTWITCSRHPQRFIKARLAVTTRTAAARDSHQVAAFSRGLLGYDGTLALRLLYQNTPRVTLVEDVIRELWLLHNQRHGDDSPTTHIRLRKHVYQHIASCPDVSTVP